MPIPVSKKKSGRTASQAQRDYAASLVDLYERAMNSPDGHYCPNPEAPAEEQAWMEYSDPRLLLDALRVFSKYGTFVDPFKHNVNRLLLRDQFQKLRTQGASHQEAVAAMAEEHHATERTMERRLSPSKRDKKCQ